ncbi:MAG: hypothetical protein QOD11_2921 [Bradyrhizobium sp.]|nr:hypothetical protein [Bradyrhizobium sp.]
MHMHQPVAHAADNDHGRNSPHHQNRHCPLLALSFALARKRPGRADCSRLASGEPCNSGMKKTSTAANELQHATSSSCAGKARRQPSFSFSAFEHVDAVQEHSSGDARTGDGMYPSIAGCGGYYRRIGRCLMVVAEVGHPGWRGGEVSSVSFWRTLEPSPLRGYRQLDQPQIARHRMEVAIVVEQWPAVLDAPSTDQQVDGLADGDPMSA